MPISEAPVNLKRDGNQDVIITQPVAPAKNSNVRSGQDAYKADEEKKLRIVRISRNVTGDFVEA